jgi:hypothetical protein
MFNGLKNRIHQLRYGDTAKRKKFFWILAVALFVLVVVIWIFFGGAFGGNKQNPFQSSSFEGIKSIWDDAKNNFGSAASQIKDTVNNLITATSTENSANIEQSTSTEQ